MAPVSRHRTAARTVTNSPSDVMVTFNFEGFWARKRPDKCRTRNDLPGRDAPPGTRTPNLLIKRKYPDPPKHR